MEEIIDKKTGHSKFKVILSFKEAGKVERSITVVPIHDAYVAELLQESTELGGEVNGLDVFLDHLERQRLLGILNYE